MTPESNIPKSDLYAKVMTALGREARRAAYRQFAIRLALLLVAAVACVVAVQSLLVAAAESGFFAYLSLLLTDGGTLGGDGDFAFAVLETLPVVHALAAAGSALLALWSLGSFVRATREVRGMRPA